MNGSSYTEEQITRYLAHINLPTKFSPSSPKDITFLTSLHRHQISAIPYENLSLHYYSPTTTPPLTTAHHFTANANPNPQLPPAPSLDPQAIFAKFVENERGRGGYCMEVSIFFNHVLRALGFAAYMTGVKIRVREGGIPRGRYIGWVHVVNIVTLPDGTRWSIDVGFGGDGATRPVPLVVPPEGVDGEEARGYAPVLRNLGAQEIRLVRSELPREHAESVSGQKWWIYQYRNGEEREWNDFYAFGEQEFLREDFEIMNFYTGASSHSFQTGMVLIVKFLRRGKEGGEEEIYGKVMLVDGAVKRNLGGRTEVVRVCETEGERVEALREWFGIELTGEEREGIKGRVSELKR